ncbi:MAG: alpha/beta hydrolase [Deltaproteobacteria bacterium]|nr:alpha/beta hydrolase [Deltaproteobacteria bacterium]
MSAMRAMSYRAPGPLRGVYLLAPGLHFLGPDDPRLDRFCRILASSGALVLAPFLPDHVALRVTPHTTDDLAAAFDEAEAIARAERLPRPAVFSISFGSQPAIALAGRDSHRDRVGALVLFGGFAEFAETVRFCLTGRAEHAGERLQMSHDPLNAPVVWLHLLDLVDVRCDRAAVERALRVMVERTWGRAELKAKGARDPIAHAIAAGLSPEDREVFLLGCGLREGAPAWLERARERLEAAYAFTDPRPHLARVRAPVAILHGRDDDVIPWFEAHKLRAALPPSHPARTLLTGMYGHTGAAAIDPRALGRELASMIEIARTLVQAPAGGWTNG